MCFIQLTEIQFRQIQCKLQQIENWMLFHNNEEHAFYYSINLLEITENVIIYIFAKYFLIWVLCKMRNHQ